jgi:proline iminopeptidase
VSTPLAPGTHHVTLGGAALVYHVHGTGPVLVALAGGPGFSWHYLRMPEVETHATMVYFELVGTGASARLPAAEYGRARDVADVEALRVHLGLDRIGLLGHSAGGFVAQQYAITHPTRVSHLVLYDTSPTNGAEFRASMQTELAARMHHAWAKPAAAALDALFSRAVTDEEAATLGREIMPFYVFDYEADPAAAQAILASTQMNAARSQQAPHVPFDYRPQLAALRVPALVIVGARDFICAPRLAEQIARSLPGSQLVVLPRSGHFGHVEQPHAFAAAIASFLATN